MSRMESLRHAGMDTEGAKGLRRGEVSYWVCGTVATVTIWSS